MLNVPEFKAAMARKELSQKKLADMIGISAKTFGKRLKKKHFGSEEIEMLVQILEISDPLHIFFGNSVTLKVTTKDEKESEEDKSE